jgi:23S rRNA pseudouridine1911/1915/1917 synthase
LKNDLDRKEMFVIGDEESGKRLDLFLVSVLDQVSRSSILKMIKGNRVLVNGREPKKPGYILLIKDEIHVLFEVMEEPVQPLRPAPMDLEILFEDNHLLAVNKPAGLTVHPGKGNETGTLVNGILAMGYDLPTIGGIDRPGIVHRLDKDTSGVMILSKSVDAHINLSKQFHDRKVTKTYFAVLRGRLTPVRGTIEAPISRNPSHRQRMAIVSNGKDAVTEYEVLGHIDNFTFAKIHPLTGRSHQIRVHFSSVGHPVVGDIIYGRGHNDGFNRLFLHSKSVSIDHPIFEEKLDISSDFPDEFTEFLKNNLDLDEYNRILKYVD